MSELISRTTRGLFRDLMTGSTLGEIGAAFQDELFAPNSDSAYEDSSVRRTLTQEYLDSVDWTDPATSAGYCASSSGLCRASSRSTPADSSIRCAGTGTSSMR